MLLFCFDKYESSINLVTDEVYTSGVEFLLYFCLSFFFALFADNLTVEISVFWYNLEEMEKLKLDEILQDDDAMFMLLTQVE